MSEPMSKTQARLASREERQRKRAQQARLWKTLPLLIVGILALLGAGLVAYGTFAQSGNLPGANSPRLQLDRDEIDFGDQHFNTTVRATFKVTNAGGSALNLNVPKVATVKEGC